jgi:hypothetical protein
MNNTERDQLIQEGRNQALWHLLCIGDENVTHDNWHPDKAHFLFETRKEIVKRLKLNAPCYPSLGGDYPKKYPNFETYTYTPG